LGGGSGRATRQRFVRLLEERTARAAEERQAIVHRRAIDLVVLTDQAAHVHTVAERAAQIAQTRTPFAFAKDSLLRLSAQEPRANRAVQAVSKALVEAVAQANFEIRRHPENSRI